MFLHLYRGRGGNEKVCYWQGRGECDFVLCRENDVLRLVQVTWSMSDGATRRREVSGLVEAARSLGCSDLTIVAHDEEATLQSDGFDIQVIPAWKFLRNYCKL